MKKKKSKKSLKLKANLVRKSPENNLQDIFVSAVVVARHESKNVSGYILSLFEILNTHYTNYEIVIVDNGASKDQIDGVVKMLSYIPCIRLIKLSQQSKYNVAVFAGLEMSIGDYVCTLDSAIDPVEVVVHFIAKNQSHDVVQGVSEVPIKGVFGSQLARKLFYWYNRKYIGIDIPLNATYLASYSRRAINFLTSSRRSHHKHVRHLARKIGNGYIAHPYTPTSNPSNQRSLRTGIIEALEIITSYSTHPLRFVTWLGLIAGLINMAYASYIVLLNVSRSDLAPGWSSSSMQVSLMFFVLFIIMVILAEYIGKILTETYREPNYLVSDELVSTVALADSDRRNITK